MKFIILAWMLFIPMSCMASELKIDGEIVASVENKIASTIVGDTLQTPIGYLYYLKDDDYPYCALVDAKHSERALVIVAHGDTPFPSCGNIKTPAITKIAQDFYATYVYYVKDLSDVPIRTAYQPIKLTKDGFYQCKEEDKIIHAIKRNLKAKMSLQKAVDRAIQKVGCAIVQ